MATAYNELEKTKKKEDRRSWEYEPFVARAWMARARRRIIKDLQDLEMYLLDFRANGEGFLAVDTETTGLNEFRHMAVGISLSWKEMEGVYIPMRHRLSDLNLPVEGVMALLNLHLKGVGNVFFNGEFDIGMMRRDHYTALDTPGVINGLEHQWVEDVQVLAFLHDPNFGTPGLKHTARYCLGFEMTSYVEAITGKPDEKVTKRDRKKLPTMDQLDPEAIYTYAVDDAIVTFMLYKRLRKRVVDSLGMGAIYEVLKRSMICKRRLQYTPLPIDLNYVETLEKDIVADIKALEAEIHQLAGMTFNVGSSHQLIPVLERAGVPLVERTALGMVKTGYDELKPFREEFPIVDKVVTHREQIKALGFIKQVKKCGRFGDDLSHHPPLAWPMAVPQDFPYVLVTYNNLAVNTLRFSSSNKRAGTEDSMFHRLNIQQQPKPDKEDMRQVELNPMIVAPFLEVVEADLGTQMCCRKDEEGKNPFPCEKCEFFGQCKILDKKVEYPKFAPDERKRMMKNFRRLWIPYPGHRFLHADFQAQEIMLAVYLSGEKNWLSALDAGKDLHRMTCSLVHHIPYEEVTSTHRKTIKTITFALLYGSHGASIARNAGITPDEAAELVEKILSELPELKAWMDSCVDLMYAHPNRAITNLYGYQRPMGWWLDSDNYSLVRKAERSAINTVIQSTCATIARIALARLYRLISERGLEGRAIPISSVHDEFNLSVHPDVVDEAADLLREAMTGFDLPGLPALTKGRRLKCDISVGPSWGQQVPYLHG